MDKDLRYAATTQIPDHLFKDGFSSAFSIRGQFREGRAAYLDYSATTPLDPRVMDKMAPYMVRTLHDYRSLVKVCECFCRFRFTDGHFMLCDSLFRLDLLEIPILARMPLVGKQSALSKKPETKLPT